MIFSTNITLTVDVKLLIRRFWYFENYWSGQYRICRTASIRPC